MRVVYVVCAGSVARGEIIEIVRVDVVVVLADVSAAVLGVEVLAEGVKDEVEDAGAGEIIGGVACVTRALRSIRVLGPTIPTGSSRLAFWKRMTACLVSGPKYPVGAVVRKPSVTNTC